MEFENKIQIRGIVGRAEYTKNGDKTILRMNVVTNRSYRMSDDQMYIESTWFNVTGTDSGKTKIPEQIERQSWVEVKGFLRNRRSVGTDGMERTTPEVVATEITLLDKNE